MNCKWCGAEFRRRYGQNTKVFCSDRCRRASYEGVPIKIVVGRPPGPLQNQAQGLRDAAIEYAAAVESEQQRAKDWDRLRNAAKRYADAEKRKGRPRNDSPDL